MTRQVLDDMQPQLDGKWSGHSASPTISIDGCWPSHPHDYINTKYKRIIPLSTQTPNRLEAIIMSDVSGYAGVNTSGSV